MTTLRLVALIALAVVVFVPVAHGQLLLSTNDNKVTLVNGVATVVKNPPPDTRSSTQGLAAEGRVRARRAR